MAVFFNFNAVHDFGTLKLTLIIIPFIGILLGRINQQAINRMGKLYPILSIIATITFIHFSLNQYYDVNSSSATDPSTIELPVLVKKYGHSDLLICANSYFTYEPCFYSKRRIESIKNIHDLKYVLKFCDISEGIFFERTSEHYNIYQINKQGDTLAYIKAPLLKK
jgi:hypothetical protein